MRRRAFWALVVCFVGYGFLWTAVTFHIIPLMSEWNVPLDTVVAALSMVGPFQVLGRFVLFAFAAKLSARDTGRWVVLLPVAAVLLLPVLTPFGLPGLALFAAVYGTGNGMITIVRGAGVAEILGTRGYGAVSGAITLGNTLAKAAAPLGVALLWAGIGGYGPILWLWVATGVVSAVAFWVAASDRGAPND
jgi:MFS family permease